MKTELGTIHWIQSTGSMRGNYGIELIELIDPSPPSASFVSLPFSKAKPWIKDETAIEVSLRGNRDRLFLSSFLSEIKELQREEVG